VQQLHTKPLLNVVGRDDNLTVDIMGRFVQDYRLMVQLRACQMAVNLCKRRRMDTLCNYRNLSSRTYAGSAFDNSVSLTFDLLTSGSVHAEVLP